MRELNLCHFKDIGATRKSEEMKAWNIGASSEKKITKLLSNLEQISIKSYEINREHNSN